MSRPSTPPPPSASAAHALLNDTSAASVALPESPQRAESLARVVDYPAIANLSGALEATLTLGDKNDGDNGVVQQPETAKEGLPLSPGELEAKELELENSIFQLRLVASEIASRVYEIQEARHSTASTSTPSTSSTSSTPHIDDLLMAVNDLLERGSSVLLPSIQAASDVLLSEARANEELEDADELVRNRGQVEDEWEEAVMEVERVQEELKEDRWITVFRTSAGQAENMMQSLEKVLAQCRELISQVRVLQFSHASASSMVDLSTGSWSGSWGDGSSRLPVTVASFETVLRSFEAKKKYYRPSVEKVLTILDKGVRERSTKNGETLRRHADMLAHWRSISERIGRVEIDLTSAHLFLLTRESTGSSRPSFSSSSPSAPHDPYSFPGLPHSPSTSFRAFPLASPPPSDAGSSVSSSRHAISGGLPHSASHQQSSPLLQTPPSANSAQRHRRSSGALSLASSLSKSTSSFSNTLGKLASSIRGGPRTSGEDDRGTGGRESSASPQGGHRTGYFSSRAQPSGSKRTVSTPSTYRHSGPSTPGGEDLMPSTSLAAMAVRVAKPRWNGSPKVEDVSLNLEATRPTPRTLQRRASQAFSCTASSRADSPTLSDLIPPQPAYYPARPQTPTSKSSPSRIPRPRVSSNGFDRSPSRGPSDEYPSSMVQRALSPTPVGNSPSAPTPPSTSRLHKKSSSTSLIPVPSPSRQSNSAEPQPYHHGYPSPHLATSSPASGSSRRAPSPAFSNYSYHLDRSQTPDHTIRANATRSGFYSQSPASRANLSGTLSPPTSSRPRPSPRQSATAAAASPATLTSSPSYSRMPTAPPSSFRDLAALSKGSPQSSPSARPPSRASGSTSSVPTTSTTTTTSSSASSAGGRAGAMTPSSHRPPSRAGGAGGDFTHPIPDGPYKPNRHNSLDVEIARIVNGAPTTVRIERLGGALPKGPTASEREYDSASYRFVGGNGRERVFNVRLLELRSGRAGEIKRKVMVKSGGGWLDLELHILDLGL